WRHGAGGQAGQGTGQLAGTSLLCSLGASLLLTHGQLCKECRCRKRFSSRVAGQSKWRRVRPPAALQGPAGQGEEYMTKRIAIATIGTQGDVQPYVALGRALQQRGYSVVLGASSDFETLVTSHGIEFRSLGASIQSFLSQTRFENAMSQSLLINGPALLRQGQMIVDTAARLAWEMAQGADAIIGNMNTSFAIDIAEALKIPVIMSALQPLNTTSEFPLCMYYGPTFGPALNRLTYTTMTVQQIYYNLPRNRLRRELMGLDSRKRGGFFKDTAGAPLPTLYAYSALVSPRPRDWPKGAIVTGFWPLADRSDWQPSEAFRAFLAAGDAPIYIGFGSMPFGAERNTQILKEAVRLWGGRVVVARGWGGINPDD